MGIKATEGHFVVHGWRGSGSIAVEAALMLVGADFELVEETPTAKLGEAYNPMGQIPSLVLPGGELMTESAAILIWLADAWPEARLAPSPEDPKRPAFLRWMAFVSSAIYGLYWVRDDPSRVIADPAAKAEIKASLHRRITDCWGVMEAGISPGGRYLLGDDISVLDLYVAVVSRWTPRGPLHERIAPRIAEVVRRVETDPRLAALFAKRFPLKAA